MMLAEEFEEKKSKLMEHLKNACVLSKELEDEIIDVYGSRGKRAIEVIKNNGIRKEAGRWFVQGREDEYEVVRTHCSCYDYVLNIVTNKAGVDMCYHGLAKTIRQLLDIH